MAMDGRYAETQEQPRHGHVTRTPETQACLATALARNARPHARSASRNGGIAKIMIDNDSY